MPVGIVNTLKEIAVIDRSEWPSEAELLSELRATYPTLEHVQPLAALGLPGFDHGAWIVDRAACMADGARIFLIPFEAQNVDPPGYSCFVHKGFLTWLELRGWYVETYDCGSYIVVPLASLPSMPDTPAAAPIQPGEALF